MRFNSYLGELKSLIGGDVLFSDLFVRYIKLNKKSIEMKVMFLSFLW